MRTLFLVLFTSFALLACTAPEPESSAIAEPLTGRAAGPVTTIQVPVVPVLDAPPGTSPVASVTALSSHVVRLPLAAGQAPLAVRARVLDSPGTQITFAIATTHDGAPALVPFTTSTPSSGAGIEQDIYDTDFGVPNQAPGQQWFVVFQAKGPGAACAIRLEVDVAPPATSPSLITLSLPLSAPSASTNPLPAAIQMTSAATTVTVPFTIPLGATIVTTRAVVADNVSGPTRLKVGLTTVDGIGTGTAAASAFGAASAGTGATQTIMSEPVIASVQAGHWYAVDIIYAAGTGTASVRAAEVDYLPPPQL